MTIYEQQQGLIKALERYGYHLEQRGQYYTHGGQYGLLLAIPVICKVHKPIRVHIMNDHLEVLHGDCFTANKEGSAPKDHDIEFLKELIPIIGRLDAHAELDEGDVGHGARLRIYL